MLPEVNDANFEAEVLQAPLPTLVDFWAEWCSPCRLLTPHLEKLAAEHAGRLRIVALDVQNNVDIPVRYGVTSIPTLILFVGGESRERLSGYVPPQRIMDRVRSHLQEY